MATDKDQDTKKNQKLLIGHAFNAVPVAERYVDTYDGYESPMRTLSRPKKMSGRAFETVTQVPCQFSMRLLDLAIVPQYQIEPGVKEYDVNRCGRTNFSKKFYDDHPLRRKPERHTDECTVVFASGVDADGHTYALRLTHLPFTFWVLIPDSLHWTNLEIERLITTLEDRTCARGERIWWDPTAQERWKHYHQAELEDDLRTRRTHRYLRLGFEHLARMRQVGKLLGEYGVTFDPLEDPRAPMTDDEMWDGPPKGANKRKYKFEVRQLNDSPFLKAHDILDVDPCAWVRVSSWTEPDKFYTHQQIELDVEWTAIKQQQGRIDPPPAFVVSLDDECLSSSQDLNKLPNPKNEKDPVIMISSIIDQFQTDRRHRFCDYFRSVPPVDVTDQLSQTEKDELAQVEHFHHSTELQVLERQRDRAILDYQCMVTTGYNLVGFDWQYNAYRGALLTRRSPDLSRSGNWSIFIFRRPRLVNDDVRSKSMGQGTKSMSLVHDGRLQIDMMQWFMRIHQGLNSYSLKFVCEQFFKTRPDMRKLDMPMKQMWAMYRAGEEDRIKAYGMRDSLLVIELIKQQDAWRYLLGESMLTKTPFNYLLTKGLQEKIYNLIVFTAVRKGFVVVRPPKIPFASTPVPIVPSSSSSSSSSSAFHQTSVKEFLKQAERIPEDLPDHDGRPEDSNDDDDDEQEKEQELTDMVFDDGGETWRPPERKENEAVKSKKKGKGYKGGAVLRPHCGFFPFPVTVEDFMSLYPSIMRAFLLCLSCLIMDQRTIDAIFRRAKRVTESQPEIVLARLEELFTPERHLPDRFDQPDTDGTLPAECFADPCGWPIPADKLQKVCLGEDWRTETGERFIVYESVPGKKFVFAYHLRDAVAADLIKSLLDMRNQYKKMAAEAAARGDKQMASLYDVMQLVVKILCNGFYGFFGAEDGRLAAVAISATTTFCARKMLEFTRTVNETKHAWYGPRDAAKFYSQWPDCLSKEAPDQISVLYGDSVSEETPIMWRVVDWRGNPIIRVSAIGSLDTELYGRYGSGWMPYSAPVSQSDHKWQFDRPLPPSLQVWSADGWTGCKRVIRHLTAKPLYTVTLGDYSSVTVTQDHSLIDADGQEITPEEIIVNRTRLHTHPFTTTDDHEIIQLSDRIVVDPNCDVLDPVVQRVINSLDSAIPTGTPLADDDDDDDDSNDAFIDDSNLVVSCTRVERSHRGPRIGWDDVDAPPEKSFVYDLETENGTFVAGTGHIAVHNTDSVFVWWDHIMPNENGIMAALALGLRAANLVSSFFTREVVLQREKCYYPFLQHKRKNYIGNLYLAPKPGVMKPAFTKSDIKGSKAVKRGNWSGMQGALKRAIAGLLKSNDPDIILTEMVQLINDLFADKFTIREYSVTTRVQDCVNPQPQTVVRDKRIQRGQAVERRIEYVFIWMPDEPLKANHAEDPEWIETHDQRIRQQLDSLTGEDGWAHWREGFDSVNENVRKAYEREIATLKRQLGRPPKLDRKHYLQACLQPFEELIEPCYAEDLHDHVFAVALDEMDALLSNRRQIHTFFGMTSSSPSNKKLDPYDLAIQRLPPDRMHDAEWIRMHTVTFPSGKRLLVNFTRRPFSLDFVSKVEAAKRAKEDALASSVSGPTPEELALAEKRSLKAFFAAGTPAPVNDRFADFMKKVEREKSDGVSVPQNRHLAAKRKATAAKAKGPPKKKKTVPTLSAVFGGVRR